ncbi:hypothetical protein BDV96DRAFT_653932 [Lophiotrema nucula]|uniref:Uncharacterized protein n=1 Tax=Lophiotrema nucula TaxID=690887 RepID=A0A6A5YK66_9PLEO|nr:hypothetical protein BDV96DRAFT_653932 [Lophiotrema nucula]
MSNLKNTMKSLNSLVLNASPPKTEQKIASPEEALKMLRDALAPREEKPSSEVPPKESGVEGGYTPLHPLHPDSHTQRVLQHVPAPPLIVGNPDSGNYYSFTPPIADAKKEVEASGLPRRIKDCLQSQISRKETTSSKYSKLPGSRKIDRLTLIKGAQAAESRRKAWIARRERDGQSN